jgi:hypothetical protein
MLKYENSGKIQWCNINIGVTLIVDIELYPYFIYTMPPVRSPRSKRGPELDCLTRAKIYELHHTNGWGATTIKKRRFPDIPRSTIQYALTQKSKRQKQEILPRPGQTRKITEDNQDHILYPSGYWNGRPSHSPHL